MAKINKCEAKKLAKNAGWDFSKQPPPKKVALKRSGKALLVRWARLLEKCIVGLAGLLFFVFALLELHITTYQIFV